MTTRRNSTIRLLPSGVPGLDTVLGGGLPEYSFNSDRWRSRRWQDHAGAADRLLASHGGGARALLHGPRRAAAQDAAARAAVQLLRPGEARRCGSVRESQRRGDGSRSRQHHEAHARRSRRGAPRHRRRRLVSHGRPRQQVRGGAPGVRAATRASSDRLASDDVPRRRVRVPRIAQQPDLHDRRRHHLAHPGRRAQRERAPDAGDQDARLRHHARASHALDVVGRHPRLPADPASLGAASARARGPARVDGRRGARRDDVRRHTAGRVGAFRGTVGSGQVALRAALHRGGSRGGRARHHRRLRGAPGRVPRAGERVRAPARLVRRTRARRDPLPSAARSDGRRGARGRARGRRSQEGADASRSTRSPSSSSRSLRRIATIFASRSSVRSRRSPVSASPWS